MKFAELLVNLLLIIVFFYTLDKLIDFIKNKLSLKEHLINKKADIIDNIQSNSLNWLINQANIMKIPDVEIKQFTNDNTDKRGYSLAIYSGIDNYVKDRYVLYNTYNLSKLIKLASKLGIPYQKATTDDQLKSNLIDNIIKKEVENITTNSKSTSISRSKKPKNNIMRSNQIFLRKCPIIYDKCKKDYAKNPEKFNDCFKLDDYQKCMICFNNKISSSKFLGKGFKTDCDYKDLELLCNQKLPGTCKTDLMSCPCIPTDQNDLYKSYDKKNFDFNTLQNKIFSKKIVPLPVTMGPVFSAINFKDDPTKTQKYLDKNKKDNQKRFGKNNKKLLSLLTEEEKQTNNNDD